MARLQSRGIGIKNLSIKGIDEKQTPVEVSKHQGSVREKHKTQLHRFQRGWCIFHIFLKKITINIVK